MAETDEVKKFLLGIPIRLYGRLLRHGSSARGGMTNEIIRRLEGSFMSQFDPFKICEAENYYLRLAYGNTGEDQHALLELLRLDAYIDRFVFAARPEKLNDVVLTVFAPGQVRGGFVMDRSLMNLCRRPRISEVQTVMGVAMHSAFRDKLFFATTRAPNTSELSPKKAFEALEELPVRPLTPDSLPEFLKLFHPHSDFSENELLRFVTHYENWNWQDGNSTV